MEGEDAIFGVYLVKGQVPSRSVRYLSFWLGIFSPKVFRCLIFSTSFPPLLPLPREGGFPGDVVPCTDGLDPLLFFGLVQDSQNLFPTESTALRVLRSFLGRTSSLGCLLFFGSGQVDGSLLQIEFTLAYIVCGDRSPL